MDIATPYVWVDCDKMEKNMKDVSCRLNAAGIAYRPHIKAHKSVEIAHKQLRAGAVGITVASLSEAEVMADGGIQDIFIAFPLLGDKNMGRLKELAGRVKIRTIVDSVTVAEGLSSAGMCGNTPIEVLIEMDGGTHRGGVQPGSPLVDFAYAIKNKHGIRLVGIMGYMGQIYASRSMEEIMEASKREAEILREQKRLLHDNGFDVDITSGGSTPAILFAHLQKGMTESRAGNCIFYDRNATLLGVAKVEDCALKIRSTVVSTPLPGFASIDAGSKTLSSDGSLSGAGFGCVYGKEGVEVVKLNEEHGYLRYDPEKYDLAVGDQVDIIPNHSCVIPNLCDDIFAFRAGVFEKKVKVDARGKCY